MRTLVIAQPPMRGPDVEALQRRLNQKGFPCPVDGVYGERTAMQVIAAKKSLGYAPERQRGVAGAWFRVRLRTLPDVSQVKLPAFFVPTHETGGLVGFPAIDVFAAAGRTVGAPEAGDLVWPHFISWDKTKRVGGGTCYFQGVSGDTYFLTHFGMLKPAGAYARGAVLGTVASVPHNWWQAHIHEGKHRGRYDV